jgi:hypothetical protein
VDELRQSGRGEQQGLGYAGFRTWRYRQSKV